MNTTTKRRVISDKKYQCLVCKNIETHSTNHYGEIYCSCKICGNGSLACIEPEAVKARSEEIFIPTKLHKYRYNLKKDNEAKEYEALRATLKKNGLKLFACIDSTNHKYFDNLPELVEIETSFVFDNQWSSNAGRIHDWYESIFPNKSIKQGYWLELTEAHAKARAPKAYKCVTKYNGEVIGTDTIAAINTSEASNILFNKYFTEGMDIWQYHNSIELA